MKTKKLPLKILLLAFLISACGPAASTGPRADVVSTAVAAALTAIPPQATYTPYPTNTPLPTPDLSGLFCEYQFCIGHPQNIFLFDLEPVNQDITNRSSYIQGNLIGFNEQLYIFVVWSQLSETFNPNAMINFILLGDQAQGLMLTEEIGGRPVSYSFLSTTAAPNVLPFGLAAAWQCGDRAFAWKIYTPQDGLALDYLWQTISQFTCASQ